MKLLKWVDSTGRQYITQVPDDAPEGHARKGIPVGPPKDLPLSLDCKNIAIRLHNDLCDRGILTYADARKRISEVQSAIQSALKLDAMKILEAYRATIEPIDATD